MVNISYVVIYLISANLEPNCIFQCRVFSPLMISFNEYYNMCKLGYFIYKTQALNHKTSNNLKIMKIIIF